MKDKKMNFYFNQKPSLLEIKNAFYLFKIFGINTFKEDLNLSIKSSVYCFIVNLFIITCSTYVIKIHENTSMSATIMGSFCVGVYSSIIMYVVRLSTSSNKLKFILNKISDFDNLLDEVQSCRHYRLIISLTTFDICYCIFIFFLELCMSYKNNDYTGINIMSCFTWMYLSFHVKHLFLLIYPLMDRMTYLKKIIKKGSNSESKVSKLSDAYYILVDCSKMLNILNGPPILLYLLVFFTQFVFLWYSIYKVLYKVYHSNYEFTSSTAILIFHGFYLFFNLHGIVSVPSKLTQKAQEFNNRIYKLIIKDETSQFCLNKKLKLHISTKKDIVFTAWGFFDLDYTLIHSMIAAAATYIIILIQLVPSENNPNTKVELHTSQTYLSTVSSDLINN